MKTCFDEGARTTPEQIPSSVMLHKKTQHSHSSILSSGLRVHSSGHAIHIGSGKVQLCIAHWSVLHHHGTATIWTPWTKGSTIGQRWYWRCRVLSIPKVSHQSIRRWIWRPPVTDGACRAIHGEVATPLANETAAFVKLRHGKRRGEHQRQFGHKTLQKQNM